jgi:hypothetical protein
MTGPSCCGPSTTGGWWAAPSCSGHWLADRVSVGVPDQSLTAASGGGRRPAGCDRGVGGDGVDQPAQPGGELSAQRDRQRTRYATRGHIRDRTHVHHDGAVGEQPPDLVDIQGGQAWLALDDVAAASVGLRQHLTV